MESYNFNRVYVNEFLKTISPDSKSLEKKMVGKWNELSRKAGLADVGNGSQVNELFFNFNNVCSSFLVFIPTDKKITPTLQ